MLSTDDIRQLDRLVLGSSAASLAAVSGGVRHARAQGAGIEFRDFRPYQPGDDLRSVDWTIAARLHQLVVRVTRAEGLLRLHLLVDASGSMTVGTPDKLSLATRLAAALAYIAVTRRDAAGLAIFSDRVHSSIPVASGRQQLFRVLDGVASVTAAGASTLNPALAAYAKGSNGPGLAVVLSDFFDPAGAEDGLRALHYRGLDPVVIHLLADQDLDPEFAGTVELVDSEDPAATPLVADHETIGEYIGRVNASVEALRAFCLGQGFPYVRLTSSTPFGAVLDACVSGGLLAARG